MITNKSQFNTTLCEIHGALMQHRKTKHDDMFRYETVDLSFETDRVFYAFMEELKKDEVLAKYAYFELYPTEFPAVFRIFLQRHQTSVLPKFLNRRKFETDAHARDKLNEFRRVNAIKDAKSYEEESCFVQVNDETPRLEDLLQAIEPVPSDSLFYDIEKEKPTKRAAAVLIQRKPKKNRNK